MAKKSIKKVSLDQKSQTISDPAKRRKTKNLKRVIGFRLSEEDAAVFFKKVELSGLPYSEYFRQAVVFNKAVIHQAVKKPEISLEVLHLLSKQSNNINQIAYALNSAKSAGIIDNKTYRSALLDLQELARNSKSLLIAV